MASISLPRRLHLLPFSTAAFLFLFLTLQIGGVCPQLYTYLEDVAQISDLPLYNVDPDNLNATKDPSNAAANYENIRYATCLGLSMR